jgi:hypothetical protein
MSRILKVKHSVNVEETPFLFALGVGVGRVGFAMAEQLPVRVGCHCLRFLKGILRVDS